MEHADFAKTINSQHELGNHFLKRALEHYRIAGEELFKVKKLVGHGNFLPWCQQHLKFHYLTANRYMKVAKHWEQLAHCDNLNQAMDVLSAPPTLPIVKKPTTQNFNEPVINNPVEVEEGDSAPTNWVDKACESIEWYTPRKILDRVDEFFGGKIPLDPATTKSNRTNAARFFTPTEDGLEQDWQGDGVFLNPPYGKELPLWTKKVAEETAKGVRLVALLPCGARFSTDYWQNNILNDQLTALCFIKRRVAFISENGMACKGNPYDSCLYFYGCESESEKVASVFGTLGKVLKVN